MIPEEKIIISKEKKTNISKVHYTFTLLRMFKTVCENKINLSFLLQRVSQCSFLFIFATHHCLY